MTEANRAELDPARPVWPLSTLASDVHLAILTNLTRNMSSHAQTAFFSSGLANLHELLLLQLADAKTGSRHPVLPLLHVSRYWRAFARDFLLEPYQRTQVDPKSYNIDPKLGFPNQPILTEGAYVKFAANYVNPFDEPHESDDPRYLFTEAGTDRATIVLLLDSCDAMTLVCKFKPASMDDDDEDCNPFAMCGSELFCDPTNGRPIEEAPPPMFNLVPSTWFVKGTTPEQAVWGQDVACAPGMYPDLDAFVVCPAPDAPGEGEAIEPNEKKGWSVDFSVLREDTPADLRAAKTTRQSDYTCPVTIMMRSAGIPLAGLYLPNKLDKTKPYAPDHY